MNITFQLVLGSGVFTAADIKKDDFVVEYTGDVISEEEGEKILNSKEDAGTFLFFFKAKAGNLASIYSGDKYSVLLSVLSKKVCRLQVYFNFFLHRSYVK